MALDEVDRAGLAAELVGAMPPLDEPQQRTALALYALLAEGKPVSAASIAQRTDQSTERVEAELDRWPGVYRTDPGEVVGFWGLALGETPHRLEVDGHGLYAWCAWDTLFLPERLGRPLDVESSCPTTGDPIRLRVTETGPREIAPAGAVLSFLRPDGPFDSDVVTSFCHFVHFFASEAAARSWTAEHPGTFVLSIEDGFEIARLTNRTWLGAALGDPAREGAAPAQDRDAHEPGSSAGG